MKPKPRPSLRLELLEARALLSTLIAESEPNDRARLADQVTFDPTDNSADVTGTIATRNDRDFFQFRSPGAGTADLSFASNTVVGKVSVEDAAGNKLFETEPNDGVNSGSFAIQAGQNVFIRVRGGSKAVGDYSVHLSLSDNVTIASTRSRRSRFRILPIAFRGSSPTNSTIVGH